MRHVTKLLAVLVTSTTAMTTVARAEHEEHAGVRHLGRSGFTAGVDLGFGDMRCSGNGCDSFTASGSFGVHLGAMIAPHVALLADAWWMYHGENRLTVSQGIMTVAGRFWPVHNFWLEAGFGAARVAYVYDGAFASFEDHTEWVPAFQIGVGVEPIATDTFALDVALRYGTGFYSDGDYRVHNIALVVGVNFY